MNSENIEHIPNAGRVGTINHKGEAAELRPLTEKQAAYMEHYFECNGLPTCIMNKAGFEDVANTNRIGKSQRIQMEIVRRSRAMNAKFMPKASDFDVSKADRMELLWIIAQGGAERITDKEGNMVFMNPAVSVSAIRTINEMLPGSLAPKEVEITHKVDNRSEQEIRDNIAKLNAEYQSLVAIDGQVITLKESDIRKSESLPRVTPEGKVITKGPNNKCAVHVPVRRED
ncbi:MAG: hypothetical protein DRQ42_08375 [Gammaproteobacteria bacterium]|nr:MAG: hypothetical protein DRQ42_08375 [Gammaproteobacteria bacterium]